MDDQPTLQELQSAWTAALNCNHIIGANVETREKLIKLRNAKHTWVGAEENAFRLSVDDYLGFYEKS